MSEPHVRGQAKGQYATGTHQQVTVDGVQKYEYPVRCEDCGEQLGVVRHAVPQLDHDPACCGLICGACAAARNAEDAAAAAGSGEEG